MIVIHHAHCVDGFTAAWAAWKRFPDAKFIPAQYGDDPPDVRDQDVLIVDFSYKRDVMLRMREGAKSLLCLDHHWTAQAELEGLEFAVFDMNRSGAGLTWDTLSPNRRLNIISYVEDRDLWRFALPHSKEINAYIGSQEQTFENWDRIAKMTYEEILPLGQACYAIVERYVETMVEHAALRTFHEARIPVVNVPPPMVSEVLHALTSPKEPFAVAWFQRNDGLYQYSLRSVGDFDVSEIAKTYPGGGGHKNAAGFTSQHRVDDP
jgi:oligoribonuclease NrnB/cAMP/cGMP phosphodiesterase (DHH superfamily)